MGRNALDETLESQINVIISMLKSGCKDKEICEQLGISLATWKRKKSSNQRIKAVIEEVTDDRNQEVEEALYKCCTGYHYYEEVITKVRNEVNGENGSVLIQEDVKISKVKKFKGPDIVAQKYWLNNKKKAVWKDDPHKVANDKENLKLKKKEVESRSFTLDG